MTRGFQLLASLRALGHVRGKPHWRSLATHRDAFPSLAVHQLDTKQAARGTDYVGPFPLGIVPPAQSKDLPPLKPWKQLSPTGKVLRATARTSNFTVIALGASLTALLVYALTSELFSKNSPASLYQLSQDKISQHAELAKHLRRPYRFRTNAPSIHLPRHRNRSVAHLNATGADGSEHLLLTFYIEGSSDVEVELPEPEGSWWDRTTLWVEDRAARIANTSMDDAVLWTKTTVLGFFGEAHRVFAILSGLPLPLSPKPPPTAPVQEVQRDEPNLTNGWGLAGLFSGLRSKRSTPTPREELPEFSLGEVHADFVRGKDGNFVVRYILVDIPNSHVRNPRRIFVERAPDVRDSESVLVWN